MYTFSKNPGSFHFSNTPRPAMSERSISPVVPSEYLSQIRYCSLASTSNWAYHLVSSLFTPNPQTLQVVVDLLIQSSRIRLLPLPLGREFSHLLLERNAIVLLWRRPDIAAWG